MSNQNKSMDKVNMSLGKLIFFLKINLQLNLTQSNKNRRDHQIKS